MVQYHGKCTAPKYHGTFTMVQCTMVQCTMVHVPPQNTTVLLPWYTVPWYMYCPKIPRYFYYGIPWYGTYHGTPQYFALQWKQIISQHITRYIVGMQYSDESIFQNTHYKAVIIYANSFGDNTKSKLHIGSGAGVGKIYHREMSSKCFCLGDVWCSLFRGMFPGRLIFHQGKCSEGMSPGRIDAHTVLQAMWQL